MAIFYCMDQVGITTAMWQFLLFMLKIVIVAVLLELNFGLLIVLLYLGLLIVLLYLG